MAIPAAGVVALSGALPASALLLDGDPIGIAAKQFAEDSYAFAKEVDWNSALYLQPPGAFKPLEALKAIDKMIVMGSQIDPDKLQQAAQAHHQAYLAINSENGMTTKENWAAVNAALGRVFQSVPESTVMDVYNAVAKITDPKVPAYLKSTVNSEDAEKAYAAFLTFKDVVKQYQVTKAGAPSVPPNLAKEGDDLKAAAKKLSDASYPFLKDVDWTSDLFIKPLPGATPQQVLKAVDKTILMGVAMNGNRLKAAAEAHHKAIGSIDAKGVTAADDYTAVNEALARVIATVPSSKVMDVYNSYAALVGVVPNKLLSTVNPLNANKAAAAFYEFKDVVKKYSDKVSVIT